MRKIGKSKLKTQTLSYNFENQSQDKEVKNQDLRLRINRIVGQLRGIEKMVKNNRSCDEILQQINAIKKAIDGLSKEILISDICRIVPKEKTEEVKKIMERAISL